MQSSIGDWDNNILAHRKVGEKTVEGRGYEPFEAVRCVTPNFLAFLSVQEALRAVFSVLVGNHTIL